MVLASYLPLVHTNRANASTMQRKVLFCEKIFVAASPHRFHLVRGTERRHSTRRRPALSAAAHHHAPLAVGRPARVPVEFCALQPLFLAWSRAHHWARF